MTIGTPPTKDMIPISNDEFMDIYLCKSSLDLYRNVKCVPESYHSQVHCTVVMYGEKSPIYCNF